MLKEVKSGLYLHVPFCVKRCPYCDFSVVVGREAETERWSKAILREAQSLSWTEPIDTIYLGGGTPSLLTPAQVESLVRRLKSILPIERDAYLHLEANPDDVTADHLRGYAEAGVNFLSMGIQSLRDANLSFLGRRHSAEAARRAIAEATSSGFSTVSGDLIFGWEHQELESWLADIEDLIDLGVNHLSCYQLTFHRNTPFGRQLGRGEIGELPNAQQRHFLESTHELLQRKGWLAYEVSNFAHSPVHRSRHNVKYWEGSHYLGLGPAAHSFSGDQRWWNRPRYVDWLRVVEQGESAVESRENLRPDQLLLERLMLALRTAQGFSISALEAKYGITLPQEDRVRFGEWVQYGYVTWDGEWLRPLFRGMVVADSLAATIGWPDRKI